ncbi:SRPBCC family protein [Paenibacillus athensensis]|uniref:Polyketide cyclase n=1 Tax=Paenibacillus athensensis TaxID=1967502 RepID=A0A4Y8Q6F8_9BACL|nr:SRPBCC family protein [Paenibacillus athensensis]MCD1259505.1 SRPBCC family protein [Paenibacillus athensensis]
MDLKYVLYINAKPEEVWNIFVTPEGTKAIFFGCVLDTTFEIGAPYRYVGPGTDGDETVHVYGNVLEYVPNKRMSYTEHAGPSYRDNHAELQTRVTLELETIGNCTKLTLINDQWPDNHPSYESTKESWPMILSNVKTYAETGHTLDFGW